MSPDEVRTLASDGALQSIEGLDPHTCIYIEDRFSLGGLVALPVEAISSRIDQGSDIDVVDESGVVLGILCPRTRINALRFEELTKWQYVAYLADVGLEDFGGVVNCKRSYLIIDQARFNEYQGRYASTAAAWGGFSHVNIERVAHTVAQANIQAIPNLLMPTKHHRESFSRYLTARNGFDRFLRLYQTMELLFDFVIMKRIQKCGDDLEGFASIQSSYSHSELDRLKYIANEFCEDADKILHTLSGSRLFKSICVAMFQSHSKAGNPLNPEMWERFWPLVESISLSRATLASHKIANAQQVEKFTYNLACYWIYRARSSIAHSRVGEFILADADEPFVVEAIEPILTEMVRQVLASASLRHACS